MTSPRKPWLAALLSFLVPGLGQLYAGGPKAALAFAFLVQAAVWLALSVWVFLPPSGWTIVYGFLVILGALCANVAHAGMLAHRTASAYELRPYNRWYAYLAAWVLLGVVWQRGAYWLAKRNIAEPFRIPSVSMEPALLVGDFVYVAKLPRSLLTPQREAIVVFRSVEDSTPHLSIVKRVIGVPGDTLQMVHDAVYRNAALLDEPYARRRAGARMRDDDQRLRQTRAWQLAHYIGPDPGHYRPTTHDWGPLVVPPGHCFAMGDNRDESYDSRYYGFVPFASIQGQPRLVYFSYDPPTAAIRWERIGHAIP